MVALSTIREETVFSYRTEGADKVIADATKIDAANGQLAKGEGVVALSTEKSMNRRLSAAGASERQHIGLLPILAHRLPPMLFAVAGIKASA